MSNDVISQEEAVRILWLNGSLSYKLHEVQEHIYKEINSMETEEAMFLLARQSGKTYLCSLLGLEDIIKNKNVTVAVVAPTQKQAVEITVPKLLEIMGDMPKDLVKQKKASNKFVCPSTNSELIVCGFDTAYEQIRGKTLHRVIFEETGSFNIETYDYRMKSVIKPTLTHSKAKVKRIHATTLSPIEHHPVNTSLYESTKAANSLFVYTIHDNPLLSEERKQEIIDDYGGEDSPDYRREYLCQLVIDKSLKVIPSFTDDNIVPKLSLGNQSQYMHQLTIDAGGSRDRTGILLTRYNHHNNLFEVVGERLLENNTTTATIMENALELASLVENVTWYADASGQWLVDVRKSYGINIRLPAKQDKDAALKALDLSFKKSLTVIGSDCECLKKTLKEGVYNDKRTDFVRTVDLGHFDLGMTLCYAYRCRDENWRPSVYTQTAIYTDERGTHYQGGIRRKKQEELNSLKDIARALKGNKR